MSNKKNVVVAVVVVVLVLVLVKVGAMVWYQKTVSSGSGYSVVYLRTGEVYVGKLKTFPDLELTSSYILQVIKDSTDASKSNFTLQPIDQALWSPKVLHLIKDSVVFYGPILPTSKIGQALAAKGK